MSQQDTEQPTQKRHLSTRSTLLIVLIIGLGASAVAYELGLAFAANAQTRSQSTADPAYGYQGYGPRPWGGYSGNCTRYGSGTSFMASSRVANVTVTGFNIASGNTVTVNLTYAGAGTAPAITIGAIAPNLAGSTTLASGWGASNTVTVNLTGSGSLTTMRHIGVVVLPYTA